MRATSLHYASCATFLRSTVAARHAAGVVRASSGWAATQALLQEQLAGIREAGTYKTERVLTSRQAASVRVAGWDRPVLNLCANNYLGLSSHPDVIEAGKKALDTHGAGLSSVRFICGTQDIHKDLEQKIARFHGREDAILYASCFDANAGIFEVLLSPEDAVLSDELNHASIIDGIRLCKAQKYRFKHRDMNGTFVTLPTDTMPWCLWTSAMLRVSLATLAGGYTTCRRELVDLLRQRSRPYLFSNSLPPPVVACASKVLDILMASPELAQKVAGLTQRFRSRMTAAGFQISGDDHPICPVMLGDARVAADFADGMLEQGVYVIGFSYPVVPKGKARIRVQISAAHSMEDIDHTVDAFITVGKKFGVVS
ncbi:2-amino-3-ketobutyrate coenzyme A ligase, mitochondrial isoform X3 [Dermacentor andersoni]|uniref:2-amino-3-ketobutyrate coenzyme A ligase, mitochondrial isoform X3 n=1 Tax=Dermacentor andersoni TaxID=34620 RepID=UPI003B3BC361